MLEAARAAFEMTQKHATMERIFLGSARVSRAGERVVVVATFLKIVSARAPKPTREGACATKTNRALSRICGLC